MWEAAAVPRDPLWIIHTGVTVGGNWEHLSSHKCGSCIFFFFFYKCIVNSINCKLLGTTSLTYGGLELYGSIELNSLGFHFENVFFSPFWIQATCELKDLAWMRKKHTISNPLSWALGPDPHLSESFAFIALLILTTNPWSQHPVLRMRKASSKNMLL